MKLNHNHRDRNLHISRPTYFYLTVGTVICNHLRKMKSVVGGVSYRCALKLFVNTMFFNVYCCVQLSVWQKPTVYMIWGIDVPPDHTNCTIVSSIYNSIRRYITAQNLGLFDLQGSDNSYIDGLWQDCSISIVNALEILQPCTKPSICMNLRYKMSYLILKHLPGAPSTCIYCLPEFGQGYLITPFICCGI